MFRKILGNNEEQKQFDRLSLYEENKEPGVYDQDGLRSVHNHDFMDDRRFIKAYERGVKAVNIDYHWHWRVHMYLWAFQQAMKLEGDFVECGVYKGFMMSAAMTYTDWNSKNRKAYLFDTYDGIDADLLNEEEKEIGREEQFKEMYQDVYKSVKKNFKEFSDVTLVKGSVPSTLDNVEIKSVAFLALDMNNTVPEVAALEYFWPRMKKGAICLMDDYAYAGYLPQKKALDEVAKKFGAEIASLPTGQGLLIKN
jgi:hypothetical protein